ncbi:MAG: hypothetical protein IID32_11205 [Planctomycetes bacterium]|nr:hypothetical protein [Planctomycetota bacterium]
METTITTEIQFGMEVTVINESFDDSIFDIPEVDQEIINNMKNRLQNG